MKPLYIDHIVIIAKNIKKTEDFYSVFLGQPTEKSDDSICYNIGETKIFFGLPYKEWSETDKDRSGLNHLAFGVRESEDLRKFETVLNNAEIKNSSIQIDKYGKKEFIWFDDPDGNRLEFYCRPIEV